MILVPYVVKDISMETVKLEWSLKEYTGRKKEKEKEEGDLLQYSSCPAQVSWNVSSQNLTTML